MALGALRKRRRSNLSTVAPRSVTVNTWWRVAREETQLFVKYDWHAIAFARLAVEDDHPHAHD